MNLKHRKFETDLYDKKDAFPFFIVRMPYQYSNRSTRSFYAEVGSEILRLARTNSSKEKFQRLITILLIRIHRQR